MFFYTTNLEEYKEINVNLELIENDVLSLPKRDISGFTFPVMFRIIGINGNNVELIPLEIKYGFLDQ